MSDKLVAKVFRYNPSVDEEPTYRIYEVPWKKWMTVLEVLRYIHEECEPISFDWGCRTARCGACGVQLNGEPALACAKFVEPGEISIDPLCNLPIIRDIVVDRKQINGILLQAKPWLVRSRPLTDVPRIPPETFDKLDALQLCTDCLLCHSVCHVVSDRGVDEFAGPFVMMKIAMRYYDPRDEATEERLRTAVELGLFECTLCGMCTDVCPQGGLLREYEKLKNAQGDTHLPDAFLLDEHLAHRFLVEPSIDHVAILEDLQHKANQAGLMRE